MKTSFAIVLLSIMLSSAVVSGENVDATVQKLRAGLQRDSSRISQVTMECDSLRGAVAAISMRAEIANTALDHFDTQMAAVTAIFSAVVTLASIIVGVATWFGYKAYAKSLLKDVSVKTDRAIDEMKAIGKRAIEAHFQAFKSLYFLAEAQGRSFGAVLYAIRIANLYSEEDQPGSSATRQSDVKVWLESAKSNLGKVQKKDITADIHREVLDRLRSISERYQNPDLSKLTQEVEQSLSRIFYK